MIVGTLQLRSAIDGRVKTLVSIAIANDGTGTPHRGNYNVVFKKPRGPLRVGRVENFPRRSRDVLELLRRALEAIK